MFVKLRKKAPDEVRKAPKGGKAPQTSKAPHTSKAPYTSKAPHARKAISTCPHDYTG